MSIQLSVISFQLWCYGCVLLLVMEKVKEKWNFNDFYCKLLKPSPAFDNRGRYEKCSKYWNSIDDTEQQGICQLIETKLETGEYVDPNPCFAMSDAMQEYEKRLAKEKHKSKKEPTNYNGRTLKAGVKYVIARYKGAFGTYTLAEAKKYRMEIKECPR